MLSPSLRRVIMPDNLRIRRPDALTLIIAAVALFGAALVLYRQSAYGVSATADSGYYISMARSALAGHGFMSLDGAYRPDWPPLTPILYAVFSFGVFNPLSVAGPLNAAMFALTVFTAGVWIRRRAESRFVVAWTCLAAVFGLAAIRTFDWAWSEPSFILATTLALYWADRHLEDGERSSLAWAAAFSAAACFSRFLGVAAVAVIAGMLFLRRGVSWRERFLSAGAYSAVSVAPVCVWMARNWLNTGFPVAKRVAKETALENVAPTLGEMSEWWLPYVPIPVSEELAVSATAAGLAAIAALVAFALYKWLRTGDAWSFAPLTAGFGLVHLALLIYALRIGLSDIDRFIAPAYIPLLLAAAFALDRALSRARGVHEPRGAGRILSAALIGALLMWTAYGGYVAVLDARARANGHSEGKINREYYASETVRHLIGMRGEDVGVVFSDDSHWAYWASDGRGVYLNPPERWDQMKSTLESRYDAADDTIIAWFHGGFDMRYGASAFYYSPGFEPLGSFRDGDVFRLKRGRPPADPRAGTLILDSHYDVYLDGGALTWVRQPCADEDAGGFVELWAEPANPDDPRADVNQYGIVSMNFDFYRFGAKIGDLCAIRRPLPDYPLRRIGTGQNVSGDDEWLYRTEIHLPMSGEALAYYIGKYETLSAGGEPLARGEYDVYLDGGALVYLKQPCVEGDTRGRFLLSVFPADLDDVSQKWRELGHESLNFDFAHYGVRFGDRCMVRRPLPEYAIEAVDVGRWVPGEHGGWERTRVRMPMGDSGFPPSRE